CQNGHGFPPTF
nr:immunoglobulin light chain junction region [Mus musculus]NSL97724.1 immunoglobulin light chain junction region [Mus musculus]NSL97811.1 immunoglobulin light chain junction region [Mus musculus]NSL97914.1 immunoglobulin light chain junction region [Mus musculus]NSL98122.1 immunoglobulin light chain junction region [Mus musculus]